jgi:hypothetical protein
MINTGFLEATGGAAAAPAIPDGCVVTFLHQIGTRRPDLRQLTCVCSDRQERR